MYSSFKISGLLLVLLSGMVLSGCPICRCPEIQPFFDIRGISVQHFWEDEESRWNEIDLNQPIDIGDYRPRFGFLESYYGEVKREENLLGGFGNYAYACSCADPGWQGSEERFAGVYVVSELPFDSTHAAGDTLNDLVSIEDWELGLIQLEDFNSAQQSSINQRNFSLFIDKGPTNNAFLQLRLTFDLTNGEHYESLLDSVRIAP